MTMASAYLFNIPGNPAVQISKEELRSLLRDIELELHRSKVYRLAVANMQKLLGSSEEQAKNLFKAVGREAITLAFKQFANKNTENLVEDHNTEFSTTQENSPSPSDLNSVNQETHPELTDLLTSNHSETSINTEVNTNIETQKQTKKPLNWPWQKKGLSKRQKAIQLAAEQRQESMRQIGETLRNARESQGLTLQKMNIYTHISINQMEAVENANFDLLPEDILIRGFIRIMANALGQNGMLLAKSLPVSNQSKSVLPSWYKNQKSSPQLNLEIRPIHLYVGYTALVAGSLGGLSLISQQSNYQNLQNSQVIIPTSSSLCESDQKTSGNSHTEVNSRTIGVCLGTNISPPEAL